MTGTDDPTDAILQAMSEAGVDMNRPMEFRFACDVVDEANANDIVRATRALGFDAAIEVFDEDHDFDPELARERVDLTQRKLPLATRMAMGAIGLAAKLEASLRSLMTPVEPVDQDDDHETDDDLIWISFVTFIRPSRDAIDEITETWNAVLARYGARCDGWEVDPNNMEALEAA